MSGRPWFQTWWGISIIVVMVFSSVASAQGDTAGLTGYAIALIILGFITIWVDSDARKRGATNSAAQAWSVSVFLFLILALPIYLIARSKKDVTSGP